MRGMRPKTEKAPLPAIADAFLLDRKTFGRSFRLTTERNYREVLHLRFAKTAKPGPQGTLIGLEVRASDRDPTSDVGHRGRIGGAFPRVGGISSRYIDRLLKFHRAKDFSVEGDWVMVTESDTFRCGSRMGVGLNNTEWSDFLNEDIDKSE